MTIISTRPRGAELIATAAAFPGLDPTGVANSSTALQAWLDAIPAGGVGTLPVGTYRGSGLTCNGKSVTLNMLGTLVQASNATLLSIHGTWGTTITVSAVARVNRSVNTFFRDQTQLTMASAPSWTPGDVIRVFSDDVMPGARPGDGTLESRTGEFATVFEVSGTTVYLSGTLRDSYTTNIRAAKLDPFPVTVNGLTMETPDSGMATWTSQLLDVEALIRPRINGLTIRQGCAVGAAFRGCYGYEIRNADIRFLNNDPDNSRYGYAILDNSCEGGLVDAPLVRNVRHAFTDDTNRIAAGTTSPADYGKTRNAVIRNGRAFGVSGAAWDTHHCSEGNLFIGCRTWGSEAAHNLRGRDHQVVDCIAMNCRNGVQIIQESSAGWSYGHHIVNCKTSGSTYHSLIITNLVRDGQLTATVIGGRHWSRLATPFRASKVKVLIQGTQFAAPRDGVSPASTALMEITDSAVDVDGVVLDQSPSASGSGLAFVDLLDSTAALTGRGAQFLYGSASARIDTVIRGVSGNTGTVSLVDYRSDITPPSWTTNTVPGAQYTTAPPILLNVKDLQAIGGSPALGWIGSSNADRTNVYLLDAASIEDVGSQLLLPASWAAFKVTIIWANTTSSTGDVRWTIGYTFAGSGDNSTTQTGSASVTGAAPTTSGPLAYTTVLSSITAVPGKLLILRVRRSASDGLDTLAVDAAIVGVSIERVG
jgi:hypothetical protein